MSELDWLLVSLLAGLVVWGVLASLCCLVSCGYFRVGLMLCLVVVIIVWLLYAGFCYCCLLRCGFGCLGGFLLLFYDCGCWFRLLCGCFTVKCGFW